MFEPILFSTCSISTLHRKGSKILIRDEEREKERKIQFAYFFEYLA